MGKEYKDDHGARIPASQAQKNFNEAGAPLPDTIKPERNDAGAENHLQPGDFPARDMDHGRAFDVVTPQPDDRILVIRGSSSDIRDFATQRVKDAGIFEPKTIAEVFKPFVVEGRPLSERPDDYVLPDGVVELPKSKATTANPKDLFGAVKVSVSKLPAAGVIHGAHAMMDGAVKYGPYNWRDKKVIASIYVDAAKRHIDSWFEGEEEADDSEVHHLGHAIACLSIILDAQETKTLIDDRPAGGGIASRLLARLSSKIKARKERAK